MMNIVKDNSRDSLLTDFGKATLSDRYLFEGETYQDRFASVAWKYRNDDAHGQRIYDYLSKHWFMCATPILSGRELPISCFLNEPQDTMNSIADTWHENVHLAKSGGGIGTYWGNIRSLGEPIENKGKTSGVIPFIKVSDSATIAVSQGCVDGQTEILTEKGWVRFDELSSYHGRVYEIRDDGTGDFVAVQEYHAYPYSGTMHHYTNPGSTVDHLVTPNHRMIFETLSRKVIQTGKKIRKWKGEFSEKPSQDFKPHRDNRLYVAAPHGANEGRSFSFRDRLMIAFQADGTEKPSGNSNGAICGEIGHNFHFVKERKIERMKEICEGVGYRYTISKLKDGVTNFYVRFPEDKLPAKNFKDWVGDISSIDCLWAEQFINEVVRWDGHIPTGYDSDEWTYARYDNTNFDNVEIISAIATIAGYKTYTKYRNRDHEGRSPIGTVHILRGRRTVGGEEILKKSVDFCGTVYCVSVPSGRFLARRNGAPIVTGNSLRRGSAAAYMPVNHPEIEEFVDIRRPTGGDPNRRSLNIHHGVMINDAFMEAVETGADYALVSPVDGHVVKTIKARDLWIRILTARLEMGEPYIIFSDTVERARPNVYKRLGLDVKTSNLCAEICLSTGIDHLEEERTAVCCLSSLNLEYYHEWKDDPQFFYDVMSFLDNVLQDFIDRAPDDMSKARYSAMRERSVGLGVMGFHSFLQSIGVPFEGVMAKVWNGKIFKNIYDHVAVVNGQLGRERGSAPDIIESGQILPQRFSHATAIAPTASISVIAGGASPGIDPVTANVFLQKTLSGSFTVKNRHLRKVLASYGKDTDSVWASITVNGGSVQHLDFLSQDEKDTYKTALEIDQRWVISHTADRQPFIDQSQSMNVWLPGDIHKRDLHEIHFSAWKRGVKSMYYCRSASKRRSEAVSGGVEKDNVKPRTEPDEDICLACQ